MKTNFLKTYQFIFLRQGFLTRFFLVLVVVLGITYSVLLVKTINNISERKQVRTEIKATQAHISELETKYFELAASIDSTYVARLGFQEVVDPVFAYTYSKETANNTALAMNTDINRLK